MDKQPQPKYNKETLRRAGIMDRALNISEDGKEAMKVLCAEFHDGTTFNSDPIEMGRLAGRREVVLFIKDLINIASENYGGIDPDVIL